MRKTLVLFLVLAVAGLAYAQTNGATDEAADINASATGITRQDGAIGGLDVIIDVAGQDSTNEVAVCTTPEKDNGYVIITVSSGELASTALDTAEGIFNGLVIGNETAEDVLGSRHFGCIREQLANETAVEAAVTADTETTATGNQASTVGTTSGTTTGAQTTAGTGRSTGTAGTGGGATY